MLWELPSQLFPPSSVWVEGQPALDYRFSVLTVRSSELLEVTAAQPVS